MEHGTGGGGTEPSSNFGVTNYATALNAKDATDVRRALTDLREGEHNSTDDDRAPVNALEGDAPTPEVLATQSNDVRVDQPAASAVHALPTGDVEATAGDATSDANGTAASVMSHTTPNEATTTDIQHDNKNDDDARGKPPDVAPTEQQGNGRDNGNGDRTTGASVAQLDVAADATTTADTGEATTPQRGSLAAMGLFSMTPRHPVNTRDRTTLDNDTVPDISDCTLETSCGIPFSLAASTAAAPATARDDAADFSTTHIIVDNATSSIPDEWHADATDSATMHTHDAASHPHSDTTAVPCSSTPVSRPLSVSSDELTTIAHALAAAEANPSDNSTSQDLNSHPDISHAAAIPEHMKSMRSAPGGNREGEANAAISATNSSDQCPTTPSISADITIVVSENTVSKRVPREESTATDASLPSAIDAAIADNGGAGGPDVCSSNINTCSLSTAPGGDNNNVAPPTDDQGRTALAALNDCAGTDSSAQTMDGVGATAISDEVLAADVVPEHRNTDVSAMQPMSDGRHTTLTSDEQQPGGVAEETSAIPRLPLTATHTDNTTTATSEMHDAANATAELGPGPRVLDTTVPPSPIRALSTSKEHVVAAAAKELGKGHVTRTPDVYQRQRIWCLQTHSFLLTLVGSRLIRAFISCTIAYDALSNFTNAKISILATV